MIDKEYDEDQITKLLERAEAELDEELMKAVMEDGVIEAAEDDEVEESKNDDIQMSE